MFPYGTADRLGHRATLGLIVLQADETIEHDFRRMLPVNGVTLYASRIPSAGDVTGDTLAQMRDDLPGAAALLPRGLNFDAVGYGCTSGTSVIGAMAIADLVRSGVNTQEVTEPVTALIAACSALNLRRLAFLSPYIAEVSAVMRNTLADHGVASPVFGSFDEAVEARVARIDGASVIAAATALAAEGGVDGLFLSCTNLRTLDVIAPIEEETGLPVLSSNQVLAWHMARLTGVSLAPDFGALTRL